MTSACGTPAPALISRGRCFCERWRAALDEVTALLSQYLCVGLLNHADAGPAIVGDYVERHAAFNGVGNVRVT